MFTLQAGAQHGVMQSLAFSSKDYGGDASVEVAPTLRSMGHHGSHANGGGQLAVAMVNMQSNAVAQADGPSYTLQAMHGHDVHAVLVAARESGPGFWTRDGVTGPLRAEGENRPSRPSNVAMLGPVVRRLTPRECERLQGFADDYTAITFRGKPAADGPRYKALGNSMAVPVMRWIGARIQRFDVETLPAIPPAAPSIFDLL
jgi:DNA (cytosine-5)-methyltransferase 1